MTHPRRRAPSVVTVLVAAAVAACASTPSPTPSPSESASATPSTPTAAVSASTPTANSPAASLPASPVTSATACAVTKQTGVLPSDRLVDIAISSTPTDDLLTFVFAPSSPGPGGPARGTLDAVEPPFSFAGSGQAFDLLGQHAVQLRFSGMTIADESGEATYHGPADAKPSLPALREAIQYDASEGIVGWYVGYDGPGCVTLAREGNDVIVMIAHPEAPAG